MKIQSNLFFSWGGKKDSTLDRQSQWAKKYKRSQRKKETCKLARSHVPRDQENNHNLGSLPLGKINLSLRFEGGSEEGNEKESTLRDETKIKICLRRPDKLAGCRDAIISSVRSPRSPVSVQQRSFENSVF